MPFKGQKCKCGHIKSSHPEFRKNNILARGECDEWTCNCKKYEADV